jgi:hypothetical protein
MRQQPNLLQWYTRRDGVTRGPFSAENITRYILLGRIRLEDELSRDGISWSAAGQETSLLPEQLKDLNSSDDYRQLMAAREQADERQGERRCHGCNNRGNCRERRSLPDRREPRSGVPVTFQGHVKPATVRKPRQPQLRAVLLALLLASMMLVWLVPTQP